MNKDEKRIPLKHGTAVVKKDANQSTIDALEKMVGLAHKQVSDNPVHKK